MSELKRILCVDDEADAQAIVKIALESIGGFELKLCSSGKEALTSAVSFAPDLLLLDMIMPGLDGKSTLKAMREIPELADVPVIFMTALVQPNEVAALKAPGVLDVIAKPYNPMTLADRIKAIWQQQAAD